MKIKIKTIGSLLISVILLTGCGDEFLDVLPRGQIIAKTTTDFRKLLDDVDNQRYAYSLSLTTAYVDVLTDDVYMDSTLWNSFTTTREHVKNLFSFNDQMWTYTAASNDVNWNNQYYISSLISSILSEIAKVKDNPQLQKQLVAEAKVHRAYAYLLLVNLYAKPYNATTASSDLGVPIILEPTKLPALNREPVQKVYDFIIQELKEALPDLPNDVDQYKHRPTKAAVNAILARTYLYMGDYPKALQCADQALSIRNYLYDYNTIYTGQDYYKNVIGISRMTDEEMLLHKTTAKSQHTKNYMILNLNAFNRLYPDYQVNSDTVYTNFDLRRSLKFNGINTEGKIKTNKIAYVFDYYQNRYKADGSKSSAATNLSIATPEMYLIRAECYARAGKLKEALEDVNAICLKRYKTGTFTELTVENFGGNKEQVLERVLLERRRELYGKELRLFDIKRLNIPMTHFLGSVKIEVPAGDPRFIWQIYPPYIEMNTEIQQNDRSNSGVKYSNVIE